MGIVGKGETCSLQKVRGSCRVWIKLDLVLQEEIAVLLELVLLVSGVWCWTWYSQAHPLGREWYWVQDQTIWEALCWLFNWLCKSHLYINHCHIVSFQFLTVFFYFYCQLSRNLFFYFKRTHHQILFPVFNKHQFKSFTSGQHSDNMYYNNTESWANFTYPELYERPLCQKINDDYLAYTITWPSFVGFGIILSALWLCGKCCLNVITYTVLNTVGKKTCRFSSANFLKSSLV